MVVMEELHSNSLIFRDALQFHLGTGSFRVNQVARKITPSSVQKSRNTTTA